MERKFFEHEMMKAEAFKTVEQDPLKIQYWYGYQRGLRRAFHGENFGTSAEHEKYLDLIEDADEGRQELGKGYRDGLLIERGNA